MSFHVLLSIAHMRTQYTKSASGACSFQQQLDSLSESEDGLHHICAQQHDRLCLLLRCLNVVNGSSCLLIRQTIFRASHLPSKGMLAEWRRRCGGQMCAGWQLSQLWFWSSSMWWLQLSAAQHSNADQNIFCTTMLRPLLVFTVGAYLSIAIKQPPQLAYWCFCMLAAKQHSMTQASAKYRVALRTRRPCHIQCSFESYASLEQGNCISLYCSRAFTKVWVIVMQLCMWLGMRTSVSAALHCLLLCRITSAKHV